MDLILPAILVAALASLAGLVRWPLRPQVTVAVLSVIAVAASSTVFVVAVVGALSLFANVPLIAAIIDLCPTVPQHHSIGLFEAALSVGILLRTFFGIRSGWASLRDARTGTHGRRVALLVTDEPIAYAAPGTPGCVVVSQGMLDTLDARERQVLFAHERAHLDLHHHRFLLLGTIASAVIPTLKPLAQQLRHATERAADEAALEAVDGDSALVARSIARAAISTTTYAGLVGSFGGGSVPARVRALVGPPVLPRTQRFSSGIVLLVGAFVVVSGLVQFHHLAGLIDHVCHL